MIINEGESSRVNPHPTQLKALVLQGLQASAQASLTQKLQQHFRAFY